MTFLTWEQRAAKDERKALYTKIQQTKGPDCRYRGANRCRRKWSEEALEKYPWASTLSLRLTS